MAFLVLACGITLAGGGVYYVSEVMKLQQAAPVATEFVTVLAASEPLAQGDALQPAKLKYVQWPRRAMPQGAFTSMSALFGDLGDRKRFVARSFAPGEPILENKLSDSVRNGDIPPDMRIVSIAINAVTGVSGFAGAGDRVDILLIRSVDGQPVSQVVLEDILVYAVDQRSDAESRTPRTGRTVTVLVTTHDAQLLSVAQVLGHLSLMLRGENDAGTLGAMAPVTPDEFDDLAKPSEAAKKFVWKRRGAVLEKVFIE